MKDRLSPEGLRYVQAVARVGSFSAAAREYGLTQPALSVAVRRVEESLEERIFERTTHGVRLTPFGADILPRVDDALAALDAVTSHARRWHLPGPRPIRLGVSPLISADVVARAQRAVTGLPGREGDRLVLREADLAELSTTLDDGDLDLIIVPAVVPLTRYRHRVIGSEPVVLVDPGAPADECQVDAPAPSVAVDDVSRRTLLLVPDSCGLTTFTRELLNDRDLPLNAYSGEASSYRVLEDWAAMGLGSALLPRSKVAATGSCSRTVVDAGGEPIMISYEAAWDSTCPYADELETLVGMLAT